jgi:hypothetical protein
MLNTYELFTSCLAWNYEPPMSDFISPSHNSKISFIVMVPILL